MPFWGVAQTEPRREPLARLLLMRLGYETYAPRLRIREGNRSKITLLFPSYIFVRVIERWYPILWTPGVLRILMSGESPANVPEEILKQIRKREGRDGIVRLPRAPGLEQGQAMIITKGSFAGRLAIYQGMSGPQRAKVLLNLLGGMVEAEIPLADLKSRELKTGGVSNG